MSNFNLKQINLTRKKGDAFLIIIFLLLFLLSFEIIALSAPFTIFLRSGSTLNGMSINPSNPVITVSERENITGTLKVQVAYNGSPNNIVPFGYTPSWGSHKSSYVTVSNDLPVGTSSGNISINLSAPADSGTYYLILATNAEMNLGWTMSRTNWTTGSYSWNDGKDIADLTGLQLKKSLSGGYLYLDMLEKGTYKNTSYGIAYVKINVKDANDGYSAPKPEPTKVKTAYSLRDIGPAGGHIFYDKGSYSAGWRYLEAAPASTEWRGKKWSRKYSSYDAELIGGTKTGIGIGQHNTLRIVVWLNSHYETDRAAQLCVALVYGGYSNWHLPSKDELNLMYENLKVFGVGGFTGDFYWSSSEDNAWHAWYQYFLNGLQSSNHQKYDTYRFRVRAVRAF